MIISRAWPRAFTYCRMRPWTIFWIRSSEGTNNRRIWAPVSFPLNPDRRWRTCRELQVAVPLSAVKSRLERYLHARTGLAVAVRPLSALSQKQAEGYPGVPLVRCDGRSIYLPEEMDLMGSRAGNAALYQLLASLEAGAIEFGTFDLDVDKALDGCAAAPPLEPTHAPTTGSDLARLLSRFADPVLALDLFTLFEHGRVARRVNRHYPGLFRRLTGALTDRHLQAGAGHTIGGTWFPLYRHLVMNERLVADPPWKSIFLQIANHLKQATSPGNDTAETSARLTLRFYQTLAGVAAVNGVSGYQPLCLPFGRRLEPSLFGPFHATLSPFGSGYPRASGTQRHIQAYRSDVQRLLVRQNGQVSTADIRTLIVNRPTESNSRHRRRPFLAGVGIPDVQSRPRTTGER
jgi:nitric oxide reductase NorD protein